MKRATKFLYLPATFLAVTMLTACSQPNPASAGLSAMDLADLKAAHAAATEPARTATGLVDLKAYAMAHYSADAILMGPNGPEVKGMDAIIAEFAKFPPVTKFHDNELEIDGSGHVAYIRGTYEMTMQLNDSTTMDDNGKWIEIWKKQADGTWRCTHDAYNSSVPVAH